MSEDINQEEEQGFNVITQYIKDFSFENINPVSGIGQMNKMPEVGVNLNVETHRSGKSNELLKVDLIVNINAKLDDKNLFVLQLDYCGEFFVKIADPKLLDVLCYVECPRLLFPFARSIIAKTIAEGGFPVMLLDPVNFEQLYLQKISEANQTKQ